MSDAPLEALLALATDLHPDPVDVFEKLLAARLGLKRHPGLDQTTWCCVRVAFIETAGEPAHELGRELAGELLGEHSLDRVR